MNDIERTIKQYESKARTICLNIKTEQGNNQSLVANFDEFIRNWEKHVRIGEQKKRKASGKGTTMGSGPYSNHKQINHLEQTLDLQDGLGFKPPEEPLYASQKKANPGDTIDFNRGVDESALSAAAPGKFGGANNLVGKTMD